jgi:hypothetical protein
VNPCNAPGIASQQKTTDGVVLATFPTSLAILLAFRGICNAVLYVISLTAKKEIMSAHLSRHACAYIPRQFSPIVT